MITYSRLREVLNYDPITGKFIWLEKNNSKVEIGAEAGYLLASDYLAIQVDKKIYLAHRLAWLYMTGELASDKLICHINNLRSDNKFLNLIEKTAKEVAIDNVKKRIYSRKNKSTGIPGIYHNTKANRYSVQTKASEGQKYLGSFATIEEAIRALQAFNSTKRE